MRHQKILLLHRYDRQAASYRYRLEQYLPFLANDQYDIKVSSLFDSNYLDAKFEKHGVSILKKTYYFFRRFKVLLELPRYDLVILYDEVFPFLPPIFEWFFKILRIPFVYDFDDAIYDKYESHSNRIVRLMLGRKIATLIKWASVVLVGNDDLKAYVLPLNKNCLVFPTVIDLKRYNPVKQIQESKHQFTIGWIGSPTTAKYLQNIEAPLHRFCERHLAKVTVIGSGKIDFKMLKPQILEWREEDEIKELLKFDVGIMPLTDDRWSKGKSGFKLIQYMALGIPVVCSPVGINKKLVENGINGFWATTDNEWFEKLEKLFLSHDLALQMSMNNRKKIENHYSIQVFGPQWKNEITKLLKGDLR